MQRIEGKLERGWKKEGDGGAEANSFTLIFENKC